MAQRGHNDTALRTILFAGIMLSAAPVMAQDSEGLVANFTFSQGLTYSDDDEGSNARTDFGFGLRSETRSQTFDFQVQSGLELDFEEGSNVEAEDQTASLSYGIENRNTAITTDLSYSQQDTDEFVADSSGVPGVLDLDNDGIVENARSNFTLDFGREAKFGGSLDLGYSNTTYSGVSNTALIDSERISAGVGLRFEIDPLITTTLDYRYSENDRETGRDVETERFSLGGEFAVSPTLTANVSIGFTEIIVEDGGVTTEDDGLSFNLSLNQDRTVGGLQYSLSSDLSESGRRTTARVGGSVETRRGALSGSFGLTESEDNTIRPTLTLSYDEDLLRGNYSVSINQAFSNDTDGDETLNSRLRLNWNHNLTQTSRFASSLTYQMSDVLGEDEDTTRFELGVSYSQDLTDDWAVTARYTHFVVNDDDAPRNRENELFIGLETSFGWRP